MPSTPTTPDRPFDAPDKIPDRVALEHAVLEHWAHHDVFARLRDRNRGGPPFSFIDGPITANNPMGVHHGWGRTLKDIVQRYWAMKGYDLRWQNGFDCQGLWVEVEVERSLGFNSKRDIESFGLDAFAGACRDRVATYADKISEQSRRLGMWIDWERSYFTMADHNISAIWTFLAECHRRGWLYQGRRLMPWCYRCGTSLSQHELVDSYRDLEHPSVMVRFPLEGGREHLLVWTTTPWTLPANVAAAVAPGGRYLLVASEGGDCWIAEERLEALAPGANVVRAASGNELAGRRYVAPFGDLPAARGVEHRVIAWDEVSLSEGTGIVHIAPGCGSEDFALGRELDLTVLTPIDEDGSYRDDYGFLAGRHVSDVDDAVLGRLQRDSRLFSAATVEHRYPTCWRCSTPLVHRVVDEWFIACDSIREEMRAAAKAVRWEPAHYAKRMDDWLQNMGDWCISRKRYWGLPLPFFFCDDGHLTVVASKDELVARARGDVEALRELHRPWIDAVSISCATCGEASRRVPEVGDCWLDAGIVPFSTLGWHNAEPVVAGLGTGAAAGLTQADLPEHSDWERWFPADLVCEMHEQIRLWFYSMLFMSVVLDGRAPYKSVLVYGRVNDEAGREMHKSWGNAIWFDDAVEEMGGDNMRWLYARQATSRDMNFGSGPANQAARDFLTFWNTYSFFVTYANIAGFRPPSSLLDSGPDLSALQPLDRWLLARLQTLVRECRKGIESLNMPRATRAFEDFADDLSNWYVRSSRDRFWSAGATTSADAAYQTLWYALVTAVRCIAPIVPFVAEHLWAKLVTAVVDGAADSVHLAPYPSPAPAHDDDGLLAQMADVRRVCELGRAARSDAAIRRRQPLPVLYVATSDADRLRGLEDHVRLIAAECNVKEVRLESRATQFAQIEVVANFDAVGPKFRDDAPTIARLLRAGQFTPTVSGYQVGEWHLDVGDVHTRTRAAEGYAVAEGDGWVVAVDTKLSAALLLEGRARDLLRQLQQLRKDNGFDVTDRIDATAPAADADVVAAHGEWIRGEALVRHLEVGDSLSVTRVVPR